MDSDERRAGRDRRNIEGFNSQPPYLTRDGLVFTDRRQQDERRLVNRDGASVFGEVEEIELKPLRFS